MNKKEYKNYGTFEVTTEGDVEGRTRKNLGVYTGYIDDIAFALADKSCYQLHFKLTTPPNEFDMTPKKNKVTIALDIDSGTWDLSNKPYNEYKDCEAKDYFKSFFSDRDVEVLGTHGYGSCTISSHRETLEEKRERILKKLSPEEREILGLKF